MFVTLERPFQSIRMRNRTCDVWKDQRRIPTRGTLSSLNQSWNTNEKTQSVLINNVCRLVWKGPNQIRRSRMGPYWRLCDWRSLQWSSRSVKWATNHQLFSAILKRDDFTIECKWLACRLSVIAKKMKLLLQPTCSPWWPGGCQTQRQPVRCCPEAPGRSASPGTQSDTTARQTTRKLASWREWVKSEKWTELPQCEWGAPVRRSAAQWVWLTGGRRGVELPGSGTRCRAAP